MTSRADLRPESAFSFGIVAEASSDRQIVCDLARRVLVKNVDWLDAGQVDSMCCWRGVDSTDTHLTWNAIERRARAAGLVAHGAFSGAFDERRARLALLLFYGHAETPDAVILVRDTDGESQRTPSLARARDRGGWVFPVVLATPHTKRECWVLNGFDPQGDAEQAALESTRRRLGFDPRTAAHRLTASGMKGKRNAKLVLKRNLGVEPNSSREMSCWRDTDLEVLRTRGAETRLTRFLDEVRARIVPLLSGWRHMDR